MYKFAFLMALASGLTYAEFASAEQSLPPDLDSATEAFDTGWETLDEGLWAASRGRWTYASCQDGHGNLHTARCYTPWKAVCRRPAPGQCLCHCTH